MRPEPNIGGTALAGGSGTVIGALLGRFVLDLNLHVGQRRFWDYPATTAPRSPS
ncbi:hypothetical protein AB0J82_36920 [Asanoa sp. NPDC049518]|uniref:hypothetical protein n=1 Tax=unclassified Asanoa TaxID=2685164 RepID=UPI003436EB20